MQYTGPWSAKPCQSKHPESSAIRRVLSLLLMQPWQIRPQACLSEQQRDLCYWVRSQTSCQRWYCSHQSNFGWRRSSYLPGQPSKGEWRQRGTSCFFTLHIFSSLADARPSTAPTHDSCCRQECLSAVKDFLPSSKEFLSLFWRLSLQTQPCRVNILLQKIPHLALQNQSNVLQPLASGDSPDNVWREVRQQLKKARETPQLEAEADTSKEAFIKDALAAAPNLAEHSGLEWWLSAHLHAMKEVLLFSI